MRLLSWLFCAAAVIVPAFSSEETNISRPKRDSSEKKIVCYYTNWSVYRPGTAKFTPQNINPYLCTHLIYAFGGLSKDNALKPFDKYQDIEQGGYAKFNGLKTYNKNLKTMLAIGGWNEGSARFSPLVADAERRKELVKNTVKFLRQNHFDGLDLDWEYPSFRDGGKPRDRENYATLVQEFREEFERESEKTGRPRLLLTMAVPAGIEYIDKGYDVPKLNKFLDWMNILSYDYHSAFEPAINHHSPLFSLEEDDEYNFDAVLNIDHTIKHYIKLGADKSKLVLGIPTYGRSYTLFNPDATDIGSPADGPGEQGEATREKGYLAYYEICERVSSGGWTLENPNPEAMGPYAYKGNQWVGFDDEDIVKLKAKYVNDNDLGGIMFWSIDNDDFRGKCHGKPYPLIEAAKESLLANANELVPSTRSGSSRSQSKKQEETSPKTKTRKTRLRTKSSTTTESSQTKSSSRTSTTPQPPTTPDPGSDFVCKDEGFFPHPRDCKKYFWCLDSGPSSLGIVAHQFTCPSGLVFNKISDSCDYARNVICKTKTESAVTTTTTTTSTTTTTPRTTTVRNRLVITASPPKTTTTTTTEPPEEEEEGAEEDEEDPGTIKELINLIKKLGGVEQLEKQLNLQNSDDKEKIKPSLYSRVLQGRTANRYRGVTGETSTAKYVSLFRNRPVGPQSPSTEETSTVTRGSEKPKYVTIQRNRSTRKPINIDTDNEEKEEEEEEEEEEVEEEQPKQPVQETPRSFRRRPTIDATTEKEYVVLRRSRPQVEEDISTPKYKNIVRARSTTEAPAETEVEEDLPEEEEEEVVEEEEETEEVESPQKFKKYSSIIRDNKKVLAEEEEPKVSGPQGPQYESEVPSSTTDSVIIGRNNVNNVNTVTSPRYVEIRRTQPTPTEPTESNVHNVNNLHNNNQENADETNEVYESQPEGRENSVQGFQRRITTEIVKRPTRPSFRSSTLVSTTPITFETSNNNNIRVNSFREKFSTIFTTEAAPIFSIRPINQYKTLNRNTSGNKVNGNQNEENKLPEQDKSFRSFSTTAETPTNNEAPRRFQFAPRTKPAILSPKAPGPTTEVFQITVPDIPNPDLTENSVASLFPSATLEPTTPSNADPITSATLEDDVALTTSEDKKLFSPAKKFIPTTSTQTTVVTSITESSYTERKRIFIPRKTRLRSESELKFTTEYPFETTQPLFRAPTNKRVATPKAEVTTEARTRRFKSKAISTTTEEPTYAKKYVAKKLKSFKQITSTNVPEVSSTTTERYRFRTRNKPRYAEVEPLEPTNSLQSRFKAGRRKKLFSKKEDDDLEVQQTASFFDDDFESNDRYILGGALKQTSEKDYLNADVFFKTVPTVKEEEEKVENHENEEISTSLNKIAVTPVYQSNRTAPEERKESIRNRFITTNQALKNLRSRTRPTSERTPVTETVDIRSSLPARDKGTTRNTFFNPNQNNRPLRGRAQQDQNLNNTQKNESSLNLDLEETEVVQSQGQRKPRPDFRSRFSGATESAKPQDSVSEAGIHKTTNTITSDRNFKGRSRQTQLFNEISVLENVPNEGDVDEIIKSDAPFNSLREPAESPKSLKNQPFKNNRVRNRLFKGSLDVKEAEETVFPGESTPNTKSSEYSSQSTITKDGTTRGTTSTPSLTTNTKEHNLKDFTVPNSYRQSLPTVKTQSEKVTQKGNFTTGTTVDTSFGTKIGVTVSYTSGIISTTGNPFTRTVGIIRGTYITEAPKVVSPKSNETVKTNFKAEGNDDVVRSQSKAKEPIDNYAINLNSSNFRSFRTKPRQNSAIGSDGLEKQLKNNSDSNRVVRTRGKIKALDSIFQATEIGSISESITEGRKGDIVFPKRRKILVRRPIQSTSEVIEEENELEPPEEPSFSTAKTPSDKRVTQDYATNIRARGRSTTQPTVANERTEKKRVQLDRRRFRGEIRSTSLKPEVQTEIPSSTSRANILLRRKPRPSTSTTTTTTTEEPYIEQQEDSRLEESKALDEIPGIQDLADPAVVAIHNLATVSPGPLASAVTSSLNSFSQTPASYTVHVTPSDIASFSTPASIASVTPGSVSSRPTSILTLKPYTVPIITRQYVTKQTPAPFRAVSPFREAGITVVTKEPNNPRSEILIQTRKQETAQRIKPTAFVTSTSQKEAEPKPRRLKPFSKVPKQEVAQSGSSSEPPVDYEYYDDDEDPLANIPASALKVKVHSDGYIECLDRGNFPHPFSCKKFISCAKMENNELLGWEYTCPKHLSFDPVGGICNWSAGLGCQH